MDSKKGLIRALGIPRDSRNGLHRSNGRMNVQSKQNCTYTLIEPREHVTAFNMQQKILI
jgi:hypothetical protein